MCFTDVFLKVGGDSYLGIALVVGPQLWSRLKHPNSYCMITIFHWYSLFPEDESS